ncbi:MAG: lytic transglycosylase domain-containing protein, partial [Novosphingobium sp.]
MGAPLPIGAPAPAADPVHTAIARAADATGVDFQYLLAQARIESRLDPSARAPTSSAAGLYQFTRGTWLRTIDRHGADHGLGWADAAIAGGRVGDPAMRRSILALRYDPQASAAMAAELARDNGQALANVLGRAPDASELYLAHFLGSDGATRFLAALASDPGQSAAAILPAAAATNRGIFYAGSGAPRSVGAVMDLIRGKMASAMSDPPTSLTGTRLAAATRAVTATPATAFDTAAASFAASPASTAPVAAVPSRASMAETLRATFGLDAA